MDMRADLTTVNVTDKVERWLRATASPTPFIVLDLDIVRAKHRALAESFPFAEIYYAVKANPAPAVIAALAERGIGFDLASEGEIARCRDLGIPASRFSFGNTIKREGEIADAAALGVPLFAFDSKGELEKIARAAPDAQVFCRLSVAAHGAEWPLTRKFGCHADLATELLLHARNIGLKPIGASFHVGSQQTEPAAWQAPIAMAENIFTACARSGLALDFLNLGGGLPAQYRAPLPPLSDYAEAIDAALKLSFGGARPRTIIEPGRYLVGDAGLLRSRVLLIAEKSRHARHRWIYLDAGRYNGLPETLGERIHYRLRVSREGPTGPVILAGPTCDSTDILYERAAYQLPLALAIGDMVDFLSAGAYTASYASVEFNGFSPIGTICL